MSADFQQQEQALRERYQASEQELQRLQQQLQQADVQIAALKNDQPRYDLLGTACAALQELEQKGESALFWGATDGGVAAAQLHGAQARLEQFRQQLSKAEAARQAILDNIESHHGGLDELHFELQHAMDQEERRRNNWVIEREAEPISYRALVMPWVRGFEEDRRFRQTLAAALVATLALTGILSTVAIPVRERAAAPELPKRMAKLVVQQRQPIVSNQPVPIEEPKKAEELAPKPRPEQEARPVRQKKATDNARVAAQPVTEQPQRPRGILAFRDSLARASDRPTGLLGGNKRLSTAGTEATGRPQRAMVTTQAPGSSGGINLASISRDIGGGGGGGGNGLEGVAVGKVTSSIGSGGGSDRPRSRAASAGRTDEEIQIVFDRYKASLYRMYNRELRNDPTLRGQMVLRLTIEADGSVSFCELHSSDMNAPVLSDQIIGRVRTFNFGAKPDIAAITIVYPIDFLPAA